MRQASIVIHKGGKETKYEIYIEDYVMSFLKEETDRLGLSEFYFYGYKEKNGKRYTIYGVGRDKNLSVFDQYSLLEEIGCRLTQAGPVFFVKEKNGVYDIKGYEVFYQDNTQMQSYLIDQKKERSQIDRHSKTDEIAHNGYFGRKTGQKTAASSRSKMGRNEIPHNAISVQLCVILVALVAIVINSTNSYDKMEQLNQSASEVFFAIENQEAEEVSDTDEGQSEIVVERDKSPEDVLQQETLSGQAESDAGREEDILKLVTLENEGQAEEKEAALPMQDGDKTDENSENAVGEDAGGDRGGQEPVEEDTNQKDKDTGAQPTDDGDQSQQNTDGHEEQGEMAPEKAEEVEALSRNVTRYYEVERGDTLYTISQKIYGDSSHVQKICELNQITNPDNIRYGQKIILP